MKNNRLKPTNGVHVTKQLNEDEMKQLKEIDNVCLNLKLTLANLYQQNQNTKNEMNKVSEELVNKQNEYINVVKTLAKSKNIDVDDPEKGKWNFDTDTMTFTKVE
jgi:hypothetical protein